MEGNVTMIDALVNRLPTMLDAMMDRLPIELADDLRPRSLVIGGLVIEPTETGVAMSIAASAGPLQDGRAMFSIGGIDALIEVLTACRDAAAGESPDADPAFLRAG